MDEDEKRFNSIVDFVYSVRWRYKKELTHATRLYEDLKIDGDDAVDFFIEFEKKFKVDISNFQLGKYFNGEGFDPIGLSVLFGTLFGKKTHFEKSSVSLNLGHLLKAIKAGRLDEDIINSK